MSGMKYSLLDIWVRQVEICADRTAINQQRFCEFEYPIRICEILMNEELPSYDRVIFSILLNDRFLIPEMQIEAIGSRVPSRNREGYLTNIDSQIFICYQSDLLAEKSGTASYLRDRLSNDLAAGCPYP